MSAFRCGSRAAVQVSVEMIMATRLDVSVGMRLAVVVHVKSTREREPNAHNANWRATSTS
jgi:hypothetical protein